ncbi:amidohydrolase family protein [Ferrimicrobium sp.]|uniref:amidohydrolase family protein n=2 Tax=Acidimicrobiaceae TaxID=84994 RepID=UPI00260A6804|nr:amidohydrolase family protein [Ferrimicrobium sp.]
MPRQVHRPPATNMYSPTLPSAVDLCVSNHSSQICVALLTTMSAPAEVAHHRLILRGGNLADGSRCDIAIEQDTGLIVEVGGLTINVNDTVESCEGMMILPAPVEPHAHLDKALLANRSDVPINQSGDLISAISITNSVTFDPLDTNNRARAALLTLVRNGATTVRTHVDVREPIGIRSLEVLLSLANEFRSSGLADIQITCLLGSQVTGSLGHANRRLLESALAAGANVVGGCPYLDSNPYAATELLLRAAQEAGIPCDFHTDETLDPSVLTVIDLIKAVERLHFDQGVSASHCVSLGVQSEQVQRSVADRLAELKISVITLPQTNLSLQSRRIASAPPRAMAPTAHLASVGVNVAAGADNVRDPFCPIGRLDPVETASLMVLAAHRDPQQAWEHCSTNARIAIGAPEIRIQPGYPAELVAIKGTSLTDVIASGSQERIVIHNGHVISRTRVVSEISYPKP